LEFLPLFRREHLLQPLIGLLANIIDPRLRLLTEILQLLARIAEDLSHLRLLIGIELQARGKLGETIVGLAIAKPVNSVQGENARRKTEGE
jgi:hypothetical protein